MARSLARLLAAGLAARAAHGSCGGAPSCPAEPRGPPPASGAAAAEVQLLQTAVRRGAGPGEVVPPLLERALPIAWVHVPKCGSSFLNTLIHLPRVCDSSIPADLVVDTEMGPRFLVAFKRKYKVHKACLGLMDTDFGHLGIEQQVGYSRGAGHFMIMLRDPEQRIISAYRDMKGASMFERRALKDRCRSWGGWKTKELPTLPLFAEENRGCATRMLTRAGCPCGYAGGMPSHDEVTLAKKRLREGFAFVGISDQWDLSMCLFSAMFKTGCHSYQFHNARPGRQGHSADEEEDEYNTARLEGVTDPYDGEVYAEGLRIFNENLQRYGVSEASCAACYREAGLVA